MVIDNFYLRLFGLGMILGLVKFAGRTPTTFRGAISLLGCFCVMETIHPIEGEGVQWACLLGSSTVLMFTTLIYVGILRKLDYTQNLVKEMNDKG